MVWLPDWKWKQQQAAKKGKGKGAMMDMVMMMGVKGKGKGRKGSNEPKDPAKKVWIGGIPEGTSWKALQEHMNQVGKTVWIEVFKGKAAGTACVSYKTAEEAASAITTLGGSTLGDGIIECDTWETKPKMASQFEREEALQPPVLQQDENPQRVSQPWAYDIEDASCAQPLGLRMIDVDHVRFTQSHTCDSFSHEMRPVMDMATALLQGELHVRDIPAVKVAWRDGAFWSADHRRLFVLKHCQIARTCMEVCDWNALSSKEFDMRWRGGSEMHEQSAEGRRVGLVQRLKDLAFPRSDVIEYGMAKNDIAKLMEDDEQRQHDAMVASFAENRRKVVSFEDLVCTKIKAPWHFETSISESRWLPATVWHAHIDGTLDAIVLDGSVQSFRPRLIAEQLRQPQVNLLDLPRVQCDLKSLSMQLPESTSVRLKIAWCAICDKDIGGDPRKLRMHEKQKHPENDRFPCLSCKQTVPCSDDLRRHSRSTKHQIPAAFGRYLCGILSGGRSDHEEEDSDEQPKRLGAEDNGPVVASQSSQMKEAVDMAVFCVKGAAGERGQTKTRCALCNYECSANDLSSHEKKTHRKGDFECQTCHTQFTCSKNMRNHSRATSHQSPCMFMSEEEKEKQEAFGSSGSSVLIDAKNSKAPTSLHDADVSRLGSPLASHEAITVWRHARAGICLTERIGNLSCGDGGQSSPSWYECVLEKWRGADDRCYLYCPANALWFWEDESDAHGWSREVLLKK